MNAPHSRINLPAAFIFWIIQGLIWSFAVLVGMFLAINWQLEPASAFFFATLRASTGFLMTSFVFRPLVQWLMRRDTPAIRMTLYLFSFAAIASALDGVVSYHIAILSEIPDVKNYFLGISALLRWPLFGTWAILYWLLCEWQNSRDTALRLAQAEAAMVQTELALLRAQVDPHFLFNVLNTILAAADRPETVTAMTMALSDHLQFSLHRTQRENTLESELTAVKNYLQLEKYRFEEDLTYRIDVVDELLPSLIPAGMLLFPVENAVKYGQRTSPRPLQIEIAGCRDGDAIRLEVRNTGTWVRASDEPGLGIGLANLKKAVAHFGGTIDFPESPSASGWVTVAIHFPAAQHLSHAGRPV